MLTHKGTVTLETDRLILRKFTMKDAEPMFRNWAGREEVTRHVTWFPHKNVEETRALLRSWTDNYVKADYYQWTIVLKETREPIGSIAVVNHREDCKSASMGYCIGNDHWHRGYTSEALARVMDFLFSEVGFHRITAIHDVNNPNSGGVMRKCGMQFEGTHRDARLTKEGEYLTYSVYAILDAEWKERKP